LHDLGKVGIRDYILLKTDKLSEEEFEIMKQHTEIGARALHMAGQMIRRESIFSLGEMIARYHHERWDGKGYPAVEVNGEVRPLRGEEIPLCARLVALADVYDALTSKRPYKQPFPHELARQRLVSESGKHFDPDVVQAFLNREQDFIKIREQFPDTLPILDRPFELPARDQAELKAKGEPAPAPVPLQASPEAITK
jgi:putative two-component system response regulator